MQPVSPWRLRLLFALFATAALVLSGRLAYWQTFGRADLLARATDQVRSDLVVAAQRGVIRDRGGAILATTVPLRSLYALPGLIPDPRLAAQQLGVLLGRDPAPIRAALESRAEWLWVQRWLPEETATAIAALKMPGLGFQNEPKRLYPNDSIGAAVLGFVNDNGDGVYGIEGYYDQTLRGTDGRLVVERDHANRDLAVGLREAVAARNGADLTLTIDLVAQTAAERELGAAMKKEHATSGSIIVIDPSDGSVRAIASAPTYDPSAVRLADPESLRDRAIAWPYEPGSTLKAMTIAAALNEHLVRPTDSYNDVGYTIVGGRRLNNALGKAYGPTTVTQVLEKSLNAGAAWVGQKLGGQRLFDYLRLFGFGRPTGIDLAGEVSGTVRPLAEWYPVDVGTASFGQGLSATPLQLAMAYAGGAPHRAGGRQPRRDTRHGRDRPRDAHLDRGQRHRPQRGDHRIQRRGQDRDGADRESRRHVRRRSLCELVRGLLPGGRSEIRRARRPREARLPLTWHPDGHRRVQGRRAGHPPLRAHPARPQAVGPSIDGVVHARTTPRRERWAGRPRHGRPRLAAQRRRIRLTTRRARRMFLRATRSA